MASESDGQGWPCEADWVGPWREPKNLNRSASGSIHDDRTAQALGFRGGTVAGSYHMEQAVPVLVDWFGEGWLARGRMDAYFRRASVGGEPVRVRAQRVDSHRARLVMETEQGEVVWDGTASDGTASEAGLVRSQIGSRDSDRRRILAGLEVGDSFDLGALSVDGERQRARWDAGGMSEPIPAYSGASPWGGPIASAAAIVGFTFENAKAALSGRRGAAVGLYGAIEIEHLGAPLFLDETYDVSCVVLGLGCTPKTEFLWTETTVRRDGDDIVRVLMMSRVMKASSSLYACEEHGG